MTRDLIRAREELSHALARATEERANLERAVASIEGHWQRRLRIVLRAPARFPKLRFVGGLFSGYVAAWLAALFLMACLF